MPTRSLLPVALALFLAAPAAPTRAADTGQASELLVAAKAALGGPKLDAVTALSVTGDYRRIMGDRELNGEQTIDLIAPDRMKRTDEMGFAGGPTISRIAALNGKDYWEDTTNRGGGGGFMARFGPGGPGAANGQGPTEADRERFRQMAQKRLEGDLQRYLLLWLLRSDAPVSYAGTAEASDGKADVLEFKVEGSAPMRLFLDQQTHLPLMLTYQGTMPRMFVRRQGGPGGPGAPGAAPGAPGAPPATPPAGQAPPPPPAAAPPAGAPPAGATGTGTAAAGAPPAGAPGQGGPSPEEWRRRMAEPPQVVTFEVRLADYKDVDGVKLPHTISQSVDGKATEEWTISKYKVNPKLKPEAFVKK